MADRGMTAGMLSELGAAKQSMTHLLELHFDSGIDYSTSAPVNIAWGGNTYVALGGLLRFQGLKETGELLINKVTVSLAGVDTGQIAKFQAEDYLDRPMKIYLAMLDADRQAISDPLLVFDGRMDAPKVAEDPARGSSIVSVQGVPIWAETGRTPGRHTNHEEQGFVFSGTTDDGFEFVSEAPKTVLWGRA